MFRSLESVLQVAMTDEEWLLRLEAIEQHELLQKTLLAQGFPSFSAYSASLTYERKWFAGFLCDRHTANNTDLGNALQHYKVFLSHLSESSMKSALQKGRKILVWGMCEGGSHMMHLDLDEQGNFLAESDNREIVHFSGNRYWSLVFRPRAEWRPHLSDRGRRCY